MKKFYVILLCMILLVGITGCKKEEHYCCYGGGTLKDGKCFQTEIMTTDVLYTCPDGYTAKTDGVCYRSDGTRAMFAKTTYSCPNGGTVSGDKCVKYYNYTPTKCDKPATNNKDASNQSVENKVKTVETKTKDDSSE